MVELLKEDDWGRVKMGRFSDADEKLVLRIMGRGFLKSSRSRSYSSSTPSSRMRQRSQMTIEVAANRVNCIAKNYGYTPRPQAIVKAVSTRKTIAATKCLFRYVSRTRQHDELNGDYGSIVMHDELGRELPRERTEECIDAWKLLANEDILSKCAREALSRSDIDALRHMTNEEKYYNVQVHHFVLSIQESGADPALLKRFHAAVRATVRSQFARQGYRCFWGLHESHTDRLHAHLVVKAVSNQGERLRSDIHGNYLHAFRIRFAQNLQLVGLDYEATRREDRRPSRERIMAGYEALRPGRQVWQKDVPAPYLNVGAIHHLDYLRQLRDHVRVTTKNMGREEKVVTASGIIREALDEAPKQSLRQRLIGRFSSNDIPSAYRPLTEVLRPLFHDPVQAIANWQRMTMNGAYRDQHGRLHTPNRSRANWELRHRPELFGHVTSRAYEIDDATLSRALKEAPTPSLEAIQNEEMPSDDGESLAIATVERDRRKTIASLKRLQNEAEGILLDGWWPEVIREAIVQAGRVEIGSDRVMDTQKLNDQDKVATPAPQMPPITDTPTDRDRHTHAPAPVHHQKAPEVIPPTPARKSTSRTGRGRA